MTCFKVISASAHCSGRDIYITFSCISTEEDGDTANLSPANA